jgi:hypothetical protein
VGSVAWSAARGSVQFWGSAIAEATRQVVWIAELFPSKYGQRAGLSGARLSRPPLTRYIRRPRVSSGCSRSSVSSLKMSAA